MQANEAGRFAFPRRWHLWIAIAVAVVPMIAAVCLAYWHASRALDEEVELQAHRVLVHVDWMLGNAAEAAARVRGEAGRNCNDVVLDLRKQVDSVLFVRSVDLFVDTSTVYCSSLYGNYHREHDVSDYIDGRLQILPHSGTLPDSTLFLYRSAAQGRGAIVAVDGRHVRDVLVLMARDGIEMTVHVGSVSIGKEGLITVPSSAPSSTVVLRSKRFPVLVRADSPKLELARRVIADYSGLLIAFAMLSVLVGGVVKRGLAAVGSRRHEMVRALQFGEFVPYFQPLVCAQEGRWIGAEILVRWIHPKEGVVMPDSFIPLAESSGLIVPMTQALFHSVGEMMADVTLPPNFRLSFNVSARHMSERSIISDCDALQAALGKGRVQLVLEVTERDLLDSEVGTIAIIDALHARGIKIAIDDFGVGHSSLGYLRDFDMDAVKIDKTFVAKIGGGALSQRVLDSILEMAMKLGLIIIAEGVETSRQRDYLCERGVPILQGYLFGRPMPFHLFISRLAERCQAGASPAQHTCPTGS